MLTCAFSLVRLPLVTSTVDGDHRRWPVTWPARSSVDVRGPDRACGISGRRQAGSTWARPHASGGPFGREVVLVPDSVEELNTVVLYDIRDKESQ